MNWQKSWAYNKYWVMAHSQQIYNQMRNLAKNNQWSIEKQQIYEALLLQAQETIPTKGSLINTYQHIWGYFKKSATIQEKDFFLQLLLSETFDQKQIERFLNQMLEKYPNDYLIESRVFKEGFET